VFGWYDNEWGYSCRLVDVVAKISADIPATVSA
jgi:glyceraldehyde-3-phosphate dehydrogenase/erythrose-4-phosphate dehydrogenase